LTKEQQKNYNQKYYLEHRAEILLRQIKRHREKRDELVQKMRDRHTNNPALYREYHWKKIGVKFTYEEYLAMLLEQNSSCKICKRHESEFKQPLAMDHRHGDDKVRGLLCGPCNRALGLLQDDPDLVEAAANYLRGAYA